MMLCDFHVHTHFCDGKDSPADIASVAFEQGVSVLGFSGHAYVPFDVGSMTPEGTETYRETICRLKEAYRGRMEILLGTEKDFYGETSEAGYDYIIGSVHYVRAGNEYIGVDYSPEVTVNTIQQYFDGDPYAYCQNYYQALSCLFTRVNADIIGHFDIISKFQERHPLFREDDPRYSSLWKEVAYALIPYGKPFEINTGAISRGWRTTPYPTREILSFLHENGGHIVLCSDSHAKETLLYRFDLARELVKSVGFTSQRIPTANGLLDIPL